MVKKKVKFWNAANVISIIRIIMLPVFAFLVFGDAAMKLAALLICPIIFLLDYADGYVARKLGLCTGFGAFLDIIGDRISEVFMWLIFLSMGMIPAWAPILVLSRGMITDGLRLQAELKGKTPYEMHNSGIGKFLVTNRFMRGLMGSSKMLLFTTLAACLVFQNPLLFSIKDVLLIIVVAVNLLRGIPVIIEGVKYLE